MKNFIFGFLVGGTISGGIVYYIMKNKIEKNIEDIRAEIRKEYKEYYEKKQADEDEAKANHVNIIPDKPYPSDNTEDDEDDENDEEAKHIIVANHYISEDDNMEELIEEAENTEKIHNALEQSKKRCKILQPDSFGEINSYECISMTYYVYDMILVNQDNEVINDQEYYLDDCLERYDWNNNDEDKDPLYVRNYRLQKDIEVVKVFDEYEPV